MGNVNDKNTSEEKNKGSDGRKENSFHSEVLFKKYTCKWNIENVSCMTDGFKSWSPLFPCREQSDTKWLLRIGLTVDNVERSNTRKRFLSLFVKLQSSEADSVLFIPTLEVTSGTAKILKGYEPELIKRNCTWGSHKFSPLSECCDADDSLTIYCEVKIPLLQATTAPLPVAIKLPETRLSMDLMKLLLRKHLTDVTLISSNGSQHKAHRAILAARSPVFYSLLQDMDKAHSDCISMSDFNSEVVFLLLLFIYTGSTTVVSTKTADKLLEAAKKYDLNRLEIICEDKLLSQVSIDNAADILILAEKHQLSALKEAVQNFIKSNLKMVSATGGWKDVIHKYPQTILELLSTVNSI